MTDLLSDPSTTESELWSLWCDGELSYTEALELLEHENCSSGIALAVLIDMPVFDEEIDESPGGNNEYAVLFETGLKFAFTSEELVALTEFLRDLAIDSKVEISGGSCPNDLDDFLKYGIPGAVARLEGHTSESCINLLTMVEALLEAAEICPFEYGETNFSWAVDVFNALAETVDSSAVIEQAKVIAQRMVDYVKGARQFNEN